jgi:hypothetical protein
MPVTRKRAREGTEEVDSAGASKPNKVAKKAEAGSKAVSKPGKPDEVDRPTKTEKVDKKDEKELDDNKSDWKPPATKKTDLERAISQPGTVIVPYTAEQMVSHEKHNEVMRKGPHGPPTFDNLGYEMDYKTVIGSMSRPRGGRGGKKYMDMLARESAERKRKAEIMGKDDAKSSPMNWSAWQDRIARDLDIPYHTVKIAEFEEWHRRGYRAEPGEMENRFSEEENNRLNRLSGGSAFRK